MTKSTLVVSSKDAHEDTRRYKCKKCGAYSWRQCGDKKCTYWYAYYCESGCLPANSSSWGCDSGQNHYYGNCEHLIPNDFVEDRNVVERLIWHDESEAFLSEEEWGKLEETKGLIR